MRPPKICGNAGIPHLTQQHEKARKGNKINKEEHFTIICEYKMLKQNLNQTDRSTQNDPKSPSEILNSL